MLKQSGLQFDVNTGSNLLSPYNVDRSIPLRDQILIKPSSPAVIKTIFLNNEFFKIQNHNIPVKNAEPSLFHFPTVVAPL